METGSTLDLLGVLRQGDALVGRFLSSFLDGRDVLVDDRLVDERPWGLGTLQLWSVRRQINEANVRRP
jgi:hypothetical protein